MLLHNIFAFLCGNFLGSEGWHNAVFVTYPLTTQAHPLQSKEVDHSSEPQPGQGSLET